MKMNLKNLPDNKAHSTQHIAHRYVYFLFAVCCVLFAGIGCEQLQRKFTRKPNVERERPSAIIQFRDYDQALTPLEFYKKHYTLFRFRNQELLHAMSDVSINHKRLKKNSAESLKELEQLRGLLNGVAAEQMGAIIAEREGLDRQLWASRVGRAQMNVIRTAFERQARMIHSSFYWKDVEDSLLQEETAQDAAIFQEQNL